MLRPKLSHDLIASGWGPRSKYNRSCWQVLELKKVVVGGPSVHYFRRRNEPLMQAIGEESPPQWEIKRQCSWQPTWPLMRDNYDRKRWNDFRDLMTNNALQIWHGALARYYSRN